MATKRREFIYRDGKPAAVILDIGEYEEILERLEDADDLRALRRIRNRPLHFRKLSDYLARNAPRDGESIVARDAGPATTRVSRTPRSKR